MTGSQWPGRPAGEVFPDLMNSLDLAMFLRYDGRPGMTPEKARRAVRLLVRDYRLPTAGRIGRALLFNRGRVLEWLERRGAGGENDDGPDTKAA